MPKFLLIISLYFFLFANTVFAEDKQEVYSDPGDMIELMTAPSSFMYIPPYLGFLDENKFSFTGVGSGTLNAANAHDNNVNSYATMGKDLRQGVRYVFNEPQDVESFYIRAKADHFVIVEFYNSSNTLLQKFELQDLSPLYKPGSTFPAELTRNVNKSGVKRIDIHVNSGFAGGNLHEFDVNLAEVYLPVLNVTSDNTDRSVKLKWDLPEHAKLSTIKINGQNIGKVTSHTVDGLQKETEYEFVIDAVYQDATVISTVYKTTTKADTTPPSPISNLKLKQKGKNVEISFDVPADEDFSHVDIWRNGFKIAAGVTGNSYLDETDLHYNLEYAYVVKAYDASNNASSDMSEKIKLVSKEVTNVNAIAKSYDRVDLSWKLPGRSDFNHVVIYRKKDSGISLFSLFAAEAPLFETNGTYFNDLTVDHDTAYTYRLTSVYADESETSGVRVSVKTPKVSLSGGGIESDKDDKGETLSYTITWESPKTGSIKVLVGGTTYKTVPAADMKIIIPAIDIKFDTLGNPDVKLVPVSDDGKEGIPSRPGGGFGDGGLAAEILNPGSLLEAGVELLRIVAFFVLLGLSFFVAPKLIDSIKNAYHGRRSA